MLHYAYFKEKYRLIAVGLSKQKTLDADSRGIQQILFVLLEDLIITKIRLYTILEKSKEAVLEFYKRTPKVL